MDTPAIPPSTSPITPPIAPPPKHNSNILIGILILILGIAVGQILDKTTILSNLRIPYLSVNPSPTPTPIPSPAVVPGETGTQEGTANWKTYIDPNNQFTFLYPPNVQIIENLRNIPMNSIYVDIENVDMNTAMKQNEFAMTQLKDVPIPGRSAEPFKKGSFERNTNGLIAFFPMNRSQTLILTEYIDIPVTDVPINTQFDQILSTFRFTDTTSSQQVLGIQLTQCCSCPTMIDASQIGKNGWVTYEKGKDYSSLLLTNCQGVQCQPCPPLDTKSYTCPPSGWVDCMLGTTVKPECSVAAMAWYKANCPNFKGGAL